MQSGFTGFTSTPLTSTNIPADDHRNSSVREGQRPETGGEGAAAKPCQAIEQGWQGQEDSGATTETTK